MIKMVKKDRTEDKMQDKMQLGWGEKTALQEIGDLRGALLELQSALTPLGRQIAMKQRIWWDGVLEVRGLSRKDGDYTTDGDKVILNQEKK